jgi:ribosomal protein S18 acetylase RimI-like enzyme
MAGGGPVARVPDGYQLVEGPPHVAEYVLLRDRAGLSSVSMTQARVGLPGSWAACRVIEESSGDAVGMGRVIGDGGWYFHVVDMAVLPGHQRRGLGDAVLSWLLERVRRTAPPGAYVTLLADPSGRRLYARHGFVETAPHSLGMSMRT